MKLLHLVPRLLVAALAVGVAGCASNRQADTIATTQPAFKPQPQEGYLNTAPTGYLLVPEAPPTDQVADMMPPQPSPSHVWVQGSWGWSGQRYDWNHGQWRQPPSGYAVWVAPSYERRTEGTYYAPGYWQHDAEHGGRQTIGDYRDNVGRQGAGDRRDNGDHQDHR